MLLLWLTIILITASWIKTKNSNKIHYTYFMRNLYFKLGFSFIFAFYYIFFIHGGDTLAFFDTSRVLTNLLLKHPEYFLQEWSTYSTNEGYINHFTPETGFPPGWIAREPEGYFVSKMFSIVNLFTGSSYFATTVLSAFITSLASFKLYDFIVSFGIHNYKKLAIYFLFIPSLSFWCTGISKDALIVVCLYYLIPTIYNLFTGKSKIKLWNILVILFLGWILLNIRSFMIAAIAVPFIFAFNVQFAKRVFSNKFMRGLTRAVVIILGFVFVGFYFSGETAQKYLKEAEITQQDFKTNKTYTGAKYDLGEVNYTPTGLLKALPLSIFTGIYRPFPWEALSPGLIINGIECLILVYLSFMFIFRKLGKKLSIIRNSDILTFAIYFVLIFAFMTGFTSMIFGILVRLRAPLLPFFLLILTIKPQENIVAPEEETLESAVPN
jgi:hypothetical protein